MAVRLTGKVIQPLRLVGTRCMSQIGDYGSGSGKGGGSGGTIRDAGGAFGKMEAAHEEEYFRRMREEQLKEFKKHIHEQKEFHEDEIRKHEEAIARHKRRITDLDKTGDSSD